MKTNPLVTIGVPFYNPGGYLIECLKSIFEQTYKNIELIVIDDGSTDNASEYIETINDKRLIYIKDGRNLGLVPRLNQIIEMANGRYIARMDADDILHPARITKQVELLENDPAIDVVDTGAVLIDGDSKPIGYLEVPGRKLKGPKSIQAMLKWGVVFHPSVMARAAWFKQYRYDPGYPRAEDRELFLRSFMQTKIAHIEDGYLFYRIGNETKYNAYLEGYRSERKTLMQYGPALVGVGMTRMLYVRSLIKTFVMWQARVRGKKVEVQGRYIRKVQMPELQEANGILSRYKNNTCL